MVVRSSTHLARARTFLVDVDGVERGTVRGGQRLELDVAPGTHAVVVRLGSHVSSEVTVDVTDDAVRLAIDFGVDENDPSARTLVLRPVDEERPRSTASSLPRPRVGRSLSRRERLLYVAGIALLIAATVIGRTVSQTAALAPGIVGLVLVAAVFFRRMTYRR